MPNSEPQRGFILEAAAEDNRPMRPHTDVAEISAVMDEISARQNPTNSPCPDLVVDHIDSTKAFAFYNRKKALGLK